MRRRRFLLTTAAASMLPSAFAGAASKEGEALDCIVIGAGVSGLTAAYALADRNVAVLEAASRPGGRAVGGVHGGWHYAKGTEYLGAPEGIFSDMLTAIGLEPVEIPAPMDAIWRDGSVFTGFGNRGRLLIEHGGAYYYNLLLAELRKLESDYAPVPDYDPAGPLARLDAMTCKAWFDELELPPIFHSVYNVMSRGLFGASLDEVSALGAYEEIAFDFEGAEPVEEFEDIEALTIDRSRTDSYTFPKGIAEFTDALAAHLGDRLRFGARVVEIEGDDEEGYSVTYETAGGARETLEADSVIVATPLPITVDIAGEVLGEVPLDIIRSVPYAPYVTCAVFSDRPLFPDAFDLALPDDFFFTDLYDSTWVQRHLEGDSQRAGAVSSFYIAPKSYRDRSILEMSDEAILTACKGDLERIFPGRAASIRGHDVHRHPYAYPVSAPGQFARLTALHAAMEDRGIALAGDGVVYPTFQTAISAGELAAAQVAEFLE